ncbi:LysR family transcriptional regulator [Bordetella sp. BOR01]|uniref:LysR family transcriptional regulator n=1 Tax=Bordetella sp. BOR01 TaxID=2854779 RepID=UPI001C47B58E|nr:LysR family transcriptional regulator [Bordetella sp. BOR01]MBV7481466.1 LysR family transcriptional regulator [Bordetella sp. BOR01]
MIRNVSLRHLRCFVAVANAGSFTMAASRLFLTQSSLTATIQQFEQAVGVKLFDRSTRHVVMTQEAARFKAEAEKILSQFDGAVSDLQAFSQGRQGHIRIAAAASVIDHFLADAIYSFRQEYPNITVSLRDAGAELVERMVSMGDIDFAVTSRHKGYDDLVYTPLFEDTYGVICNAAHPLSRKKTTVRWAELDPSDYVGFTADTGIGAFLREHARENLALFDGQRDEISSTTSLYAVLRVGGRYSILPALAASVGEFSAFTFRELTSPRLAREVCLITRRLRSLSPGSEHFLRFMRETMQEKPVPPGVRLVKGKKK